MRRRFLLFGTPVLVASVALAATLLLPRRVEPGPNAAPASSAPASTAATSTSKLPIAWGPDRVIQGLSLGERLSRIVTLTSATDLKDLRLEAVPTLQPYLQIDPPTISFLFGQAARTVRLSFAVPVGAPLGIYDGTVHGRQGTKTLPATLKVVLTIFDDAVPPPDPGSAGNTTLEGIDSDSDGVRDDVQRYIALTYPDSRKTRAALRQGARAYQAALLDASDRQASIADIIAVLHYNECLRYVRPNDQPSIGNELEARFLNTVLRSRAWVKAGDNFGGQVYALPADSELKTRCAFDPDAMEN